MAEGEGTLTGSRVGAYQFIELIDAGQLLLGIVGIGGALLASAAQSGVATPTRPSATLASTHVIIGPLNTPFPTATPKSTAPSAPRPTATATITPTPTDTPPTP
jgi:hypothetical protein